MVSNLELILFAVTTIALQSSALNFTVFRSGQDRFQTSSRNCSLCSAYKGVCTAANLSCQCPKERSAFAVYRKACISAATLTKDNSCLTRVDGRDDTLSFVNPTSTSWFEFKILDSSIFNCAQRVQETRYLNSAGWKLGSVKELFTVKNISNSSSVLSLKVKDISGLQVLAGRLVRVDIVCSGKNRRSCVLFKVKGNLIYSSLPQVPSTGIPTSKNPTTPTAPTVDKAITSDSSHSETTDQAPGTTEDFKRGRVVFIEHDDDDDDMMDVLVPAITAVVCFLILCVFGFVIVRYHLRLRHRSESSTPDDLVVENGSTQGVIPMCNVPGNESEPVYSEVHDVVKTANRSCFLSSTSSLNTIIEDPFMVRNQVGYNTLPKARKNTDPLPVLPVHPPPVRPRTLEPLGLFRSETDHPWNTRTAKFLHEVNKRGCMSLSRDTSYRVGRQRSSTDVDTLDDVFFEKVLFRRAESDDDDDDDSGGAGRHSNICDSNGCDDGDCVSGVSGGGARLCGCDGKNGRGYSCSCGSNNNDLGCINNACSSCHDLDNCDGGCGDDASGGSCDNCDDNGRCAKKKRFQQRSESFYQELHSNDGSKVSLYESLQDATKESPTTRHTTLERINKQNGYRNRGLSLQDELDPEYFILEPPNQDENCALSESDSLSCNDDVVDRSELPEYHILEGPGEMQQQGPIQTEQPTDLNTGTSEEECHSKKGSLKRHNIERGSSKRDNIQSSSSKKDNIKMGFSKKDNRKVSSKNRRSLNMDVMGQISMARKGAHSDRDINGSLKSPNQNRGVSGELKGPYLDRDVQEITNKKLHTGPTKNSDDGPLSLSENNKTSENLPLRDSLINKDLFKSRKLTRSLSDSHLNYIVLSFQD